MSRVPLDIQIAALREEADHAARYAQSVAGMVRLQPAADARRDALRAALDTIEEFERFLNAPITPAEMKIRDAARGGRGEWLAGVRRSPIAAMDEMLRRRGR